MKARSLLLVLTAAGILGFPLYGQMKGKEEKADCSFPFFSLYERQAAARCDGEGNLTLYLRVDLHSPDCGAPDCFGHDMEVKMNVFRREGKPMLAGAISKNTTFTCTGDTAGALVAGIHPVNVFVPLHTADLSDPELEEIILHDGTRNQALVLRREGYAFYENGLPPENDRSPAGADEESDRYFPATGSASRFWGME